MYLDIKLVQKDLQNVCSKTLVNYLSCVLLSKKKAFVQWNYWNMDRVRLELVQSKHLAHLLLFEVNYHHCYCYRHLLFRVKDCYYHCYLLSEIKCHCHYCHLLFEINCHLLFKVNCHLLFEVNRHLLFEVNYHYHHYHH